MRDNRSPATALPVRWDTRRGFLRRRAKDFMEPFRDIGLIRHLHGESREEALAEGPGGGRTFLKGWPLRSRFGMRGAVDRQGTKTRPGGNIRGRSGGLLVTPALCGAFTAATVWPLLVPLLNFRRV